jgi:hypothetical protein
MKKSIVALALVCTAGSAYAQDVKGKMILGVNADLGASYTTGDVESGYSSETDFAYSLGLWFGYGIRDSGMIIAGVEYAYKPLFLKYSYNGISGNYTLKQSYLDIDLAYRILLLSPVYFDLGSYYGVRIGDMKYKGTGGLSGSGTIKDGKNGDKLSNDFGLLLGAGYLLAFNDKVNFDFGIKIKYGFLDVYQDNTVTKLRNVTGAITLGANYSL